MLTCASCGRENPDEARFCMACAAPLGAVTRPREQRKVVTVLFCDVSGSTALGERIDPEALRGVMSGYFDAARASIERHGGTVEKFIGDAVMAVFGVPVVHEDDALRAVRAALELRDGVEVDVRIGVNTGEVVTGGLETLATGDAVNIAARLEQAAGVGEVLIGGETYRLVRDVIDAELLPPLEAKGKSQPLTAYRVRAVTGEPRRSVGAAMLGREQELELLQRAYARTRQESTCHLFTVLGTAGIGKSRLVTEFLAELDGARVLRGRCLSYGEGITYWPVVEILKQLGALPDEEALRAPLDALLGAEAAVTTPPEAAWAVRRTLERKALEGPLVVVFDDIQWGEPTFLDLVEQVADVSRGAPILLLCMARPELLDVRPAWGGGKHNATSVLLEPLPAAETDKLVRALLTDADEALSARIAEAAAGNPLFAEEMAELAHSSGGEVAVPPTIQALLAARLDSLPREERVVLECGAVEGEVFHRGAVTALEPGDAQLDARLVGLVRKELVRPETPTLASDDAYRFRHLLIRDAAYDSLPKATRIELHGRFAEWLRERAPDLVELDEIVGYHLEQACRYRRELELAIDRSLAERAAAHLTSAGRRALLRADYSAAANLLERAAALGSEADLDVGLEIDIIRTLFVSGRIDESARRAMRASQRAAASGDRAAELCFLLEYGQVKTFSEPEGVVDALEVLANEALPLFEAENHGLGLCTAYTALGEVAHMRAQMDTGLAAYENASAQARRLGLHHREKSLQEWIAAARLGGTTPLPDVLSWLEQQETTGAANVNLRFFRAIAKAMTGAIEEARAEMHAVRAELAELGMTLLRAQMQALGLVELELLAGEPEAAIVVGTEGCRLLEELGERSWLSTGAGYLAQALYAVERLDEAEAWAERSKKLGASDDAATQMLWRQVTAKVLARRGDLVEAERQAREAVLIGARTDHLDLQAHAQLDLGSVLELVGKPGDARAAFEHSLELFERKGNAVMAERVREIIAAQVT